MPLGRLALLLLATSLAAPAAAVAAPPANDAPGAAAEFGTFDPPNSSAPPSERSSVAELVEATADRGVPQCLGSGSFARTVWYRVAPTDGTRELTVEATGRTTALVDLAAFVQPASGSNTSEPNACSGEGAAASEASEEPSSAVSLRVPAGRGLLVQVGRRGTPGSAEDERAIVSLAASDVMPEVPRPGGDEVSDAPDADDRPFAIGGATTTEDDPAQPACAALGSVWRRLPGGAGDVVVLGEAVGAVTVFAGARPDGENAVACADRERAGALRVRVDRSGPVWVRIGTDRPASDATATLAASAAPPGAPSGASGSPTAGRPGTTGGPTDRPGSTPCVPRPQGRSRSARTRVSLSLAGRRQSLRRRNRFRSLPLTVQVFRGPACGVRLRLVGPRGRVYARGAERRISSRRALRLRRSRRLVRGTYRLRVTAVDRSGRRFTVSSTSRLRLR